MKGTIIKGLGGLYTVSDGETTVEVKAKGTFRKEKLVPTVGDFVEVGCGTVLNPGTIVGKNTNIYPLSSVRAGLPSPPVWVESRAVGSAQGCTPMAARAGSTTARLHRPTQERSCMHRTVCCFCMRALLSSGLHRRRPAVIL